MLQCTLLSSYISSGLVELDQVPQNNGHVFVIFSKRLLVGGQCSGEECLRFGVFPLVNQQRA